jgi:amidohydrolase
MPVINLIAEFVPDMIGWRHDIHACPELGFDVRRTSDFVAAHLRAFGCDEVVTGIGHSGVVGVIAGRRASEEKGVRVTALRADMDALPIEEATGLPYASKSKGFMHACGHDGHTTMLLGAARYLAETRNFSGKAIVVFQPAEEIGTGARAMLSDGLMDRFGIEQVFGMHNCPGLPIGMFGIKQGPVMAATDGIEIAIEGRGGHPGMPHNCIDAILVSSQLISSLQQILTQSIDPLDAAAISFHEVQAGSPQRIIAQSAKLRGSMRSLKPAVRQQLKTRVAEVVSGIALVTGAKINLAIEPTDAVVFNHADQTEFATRIAKELVGNENVIETPPILAGEDFSYLAEARPGAFIWCGNGDSAELHHATYNFNDEALIFGASLWCKLVEGATAA